MHREGEHGRVIGKDGGRAVSLVDVAINHDRLANTPFGLQHANGHRHVIEDAKASAGGGRGVMRTPGEVHGDVIDQSGTAGLDSCPGGSSSPFDQLAGPGKANPALFQGGEQTRCDLVHVGRIVSQGQLRVAGGRRYHALDLPAKVRHHPLTQQPVLFQRESMILRQGKLETVCAKYFHGKRTAPPSWRRQVVRGGKRRAMSSARARLRLFASPRGDAM